MRRSARSLRSQDPAAPARAAHRADAALLRSGRRPHRARMATTSASQTRRLSANDFGPLQENPLFTATLRDNIVYGRIDATGGRSPPCRRRARTRRVRRSLPADLIRCWARKVPSSSDRSGATHRAGARAFLRNTPILILDERLSALDSVMENLVICAYPANGSMSGRASASCCSPAHRRKHRRARRSHLPDLLMDAVSERTRAHSTTHVSRRCQMAEHAAAIVSIEANHNGVPPDTRARARKHNLRDRSRLAEFPQARDCSSKGGSFFAAASEAGALIGESRSPRCCYSYHAIGRKSSSTM